MAKRKSLLKNLQKSYASLILGTIVVIILGLLVANFFTRKNQQIDSGKQTEQDQQEATLQKHTIIPNDSLSKLAEKYYGSQDFWPVLARVNKIANPNIIFVDSTLEIPRKEEAEKIRGEMTQTSYKVQEGDTLFLIAQKMYGDGSKWKLIDRSNRVGRLPNGNPLIFSGSTLKIPR